MTYLIACLSTGKGTWTEVKNLLKFADWKKVMLFTNDFGKEKFTDEKAELIVVDWNNGLKNSIGQIKEKLSEIKETEVALNLESGTGFEHMAIISAIINSGLGFRLVTAKNDKIIEI